MAMSTADSMLNVASSMVAYDLVNPLRKNKLTDKQQLYLGFYRSGEVSVN